MLLKKIFYLAVMTMVIIAACRDGGGDATNEQPPPEITLNKCAHDGECPSGTACFNGLCSDTQPASSTPDPCANISCGQDENCKDGKCVAAETASIITPATESPPTTTTGSGSEPTEGVKPKLEPDPDSKPATVTEHEPPPETSLKPKTSDSEHSAQATQASKQTADASVPAPSVSCQPACTGGNVCVSGQCVPGTAQGNEPHLGKLNGACLENEDCGSGLSCIGGKCATATVDIQPKIVATKDTAANAMKDLAETPPPATPPAPPPAEPAESPQATTPSPSCEETTPIVDCNKGGIAVFGKDQDGRMVYYVWSSDSGWGNKPHCLLSLEESNKLVGMPTAVAAGEKTYLFMTNSKNRISYLHLNLGKGKKSKLQEIQKNMSFDYTIVGSPTAVYNPLKNVVLVYARSKDNYLLRWEIFSDNSIGSSKTTTPKILGQPKVASNNGQDQVLHVFAKGANGQLFYNRETYSENNAGYDSYSRLVGAEGIANSWQPGVAAKFGQLYVATVDSNLKPRLLKIDGENMEEISLDWGLDQVATVQSAPDLFFNLVDPCQYFIVADNKLWRGPIVGNSFKSKKALPLASPTNPINGYASISLAQNFSNNFTEVLVDYNGELRRFHGNYMSTPLTEDGAPPWAGSTFKSHVEAVPIYCGAKIPSSPQQSDNDSEPPPVFGTE